MVIKDLASGISPLFGLKIFLQIAFTDLMFCGIHFGTRGQSPALPLNSNGRLDFPGPTQEEARIPRCNARILLQLDRKSTRLNSSHSGQSRMPSSA